MTEQQLLELTGKPLELALGEVLQGEVPCWHKVIINSHATEQCLKCESCYLIGKEFLYDKTCQVPDPIPLTPDNAFKWRDWAVEKFGVVRFRGAMDTIYHDLLDKRGDDGWRRHDSRIDFLLSDALPSDYLKAAALSEIRNKK